MNRNENFISTGVETRHAQSRGYHVVATRDMEAGTLVLQEEPYVSGAIPTVLPAHCRSCLKRVTPSTKGRLRCHSCNRVHFCDAVCYRHDAAAHARSGECWLFQQLSACDRFGAWCREATAALRYHERGLLQPALQTHSHVVMTSVEEDMGLSTAHLMLDVMALAAARGTLICFDPRSDAEMDALRASLHQAFCCVLVNALEVEPVTGTQLPPLAHVMSAGQAAATEFSVPIALYKFFSFFNHSCRPRTAYHFRSGGCLQLRALTAVAKGEELCISYIPLTAPTWARRGALRERYGFMCECDRCGPAATLAAHRPEMSTATAGGDGPRHSLEEAATSTIADAGRNDRPLEQLQQDQQQTWSRDWFLSTDSWGPTDGDSAAQLVSMQASVTVFGRDDSQGCLELLDRQLPELVRTHAAVHPFHACLLDAYAKGACAARLCATAAAAAAAAAATATSTSPAGPAGSYTHTTMDSAANYAAIGATAAVAMQGSRGVQAPPDHTALAGGPERGLSSAGTPSRGGSSSHEGSAWGIAGEGNQEAAKEGSAQATMELRCWSLAVCYLLLEAAAAEELLSAGEFGLVTHAAKVWSDVIVLVCEAIAAILPLCHSSDLVATSDNANAGSVCYNDSTAASQLANRAAMAGWESLEQRLCATVAAAAHLDHTGAGPIVKSIIESAAASDVKPSGHTICTDPCGLNVEAEGHDSKRQRRSVSSHVSKQQHQQQQEPHKQCGHQDVHIQRQSCLAGLEQCPATPVGNTASPIAHISLSDAAVFAAPAAFRDTVVSPLWQACSKVAGLSWPPSACGEEHCLWLAALHTATVSVLVEPCKQLAGELQSSNDGTCNKPIQCSKMGGVKGEVCGDHTVCLKGPTVPGTSSCGTGHAHHSSHVEVAVALASAAPHLLARAQFLLASAYGSGHPAYAAASFSPFFHVGLPHPLASAICQGASVLHKHDLTR